MRRLDREKKPEEKGATFWPNQVFAESLAMLVVALGLMLVALFFPPAHEIVARPSDTSYVPRPEWYFLFLFELLKFFPGELEVVGVVVIPGVVVLLLLLLPFFDRSPEKRPWNRPLASAAALIGVTGVIFLTINAMSGAPPAITSRAALVELGSKVYREQGCSACHSINGVGGSIGPDLAGIGERSTLSRVHKYLEDPLALNPQSAMPGFVGTLKQEEIEATALYLMSLKKELPPAAISPSPSPEGITPTPQIPSSPAATPIGVTPTPVAPSGPPLIPHTLEGRQGICLVCHKDGIGGAPKVPDFHISQSFTNDMCLGCHRSKQ